MGSCFSKGSGSGSGSGGNFRGEGHVLGGGGSNPAAVAARPAPASSTTGGGGYGTVNAPASSVPPNVTTGRTTGGSVSGGRTLGGASAGPRAGEGGTEGGSDDPKSKAAQAAMARFNRDQGSGADLSKKLRAQKGMTRDALLKEESERERARRAADQAAEARSYN
ncbi:hypothetical protein NEUTE1DRAFT_91811 [Neurospora tetrasperma FGSC 2508]|uniref:Uncharacterized protein n=1 Tax=Neurospora tetrasperma (strain FGSC 2508 / ATCC MYA-4615 / P0657) TaxID=510951 RepID=F8N0D3_NEUT8|nr:uncharacterized protein NEUTE1DRAFT_91811 [Neurospora tetrasperma FGSC 2508]EGO52961.1 hypothetical protein NEUTE1DRAFT_91811 [Neurospora tetrasperma FGSC 2508]